ncbi:MAG: 5'-nucleotidase C-terminal domain-containing protein [Oligoflexia bacterium]|nr:5'-nucleotidase C-terminal domain-containing protein [Oligoflexia bacterium]
MRSVFFLLFFALIGCSSISTGPNLNQYDHIVVVGTNDFHGFLRPVVTDVEQNKVIVGGAEWFAGYIRALEKKFGDRLVLLDGGDLFQGTLESNRFLGKPVIDYYNLLPYRAASVGNHEFDYGPRKKGDKDRLGAFKDRMAQANFPFVQANIFWKKQKTLWREKNLYPSVVVNAGAYKVGIIGLTTTTTPAKTLPQNVEELEFRDFYEPTVQEIKNLKSRGVDFIFITTHEGGEKVGGPLHDLLHKLPPGSIDAVVSGHAHAEVHEFVNGVPVIQSKARGLNFGRIDLYVDKKTKKINPEFTKIHEMHWICGTWFKNSDSCDQQQAKKDLASKKYSVSDLFPLRAAQYEGIVITPDLSVREILAPYFAEADEIKKEKLGIAKVDFDYYSSGESQMGDLFLDAFHWKFPQAKIVYLNGGGFRRKLFQGDITYGDIYEVSPFDNYAVTVRINGRDLKDILEVGLSGSQSIPMIWGATVAYSKNNRIDRDINKDGKKEPWERSSNIDVRWNNGQPVKDIEQFWFATNDYLVSGGDNLDLVFTKIPASSKKFSDYAVRDVAAEYLRKHPKLDLPVKRKERIHVRD